ncbi:MAG: exonuclease domain-containing protein [Chitinophagaceae bacterium]
MPEKKTYAIIDVETTGGMGARQKITEVAIYIHDGDRITDQFSSLVNPESNIPYFISRLTGITNEMVADAPKFCEIARQVVELTRGRIMVAHHAAFDYGAIKNEFQQLGYTFRMPKLCTVKLSRKWIPGQPSYSLGKLCASLGIEIRDRHRAAGDARATVHLFERLLEAERQHTGEVTRQSLNGLAREPDHSLTEHLPEETGVYYFFNRVGELIYVGKSRNIKSRVIAHLSNLSSRKAIRMSQEIASVDYLCTGSELVALLKESDEIKQKKPLYNRAQRRTGQVACITSCTDENGYLKLFLDKTANVGEPLGVFDHMMTARNFLFHLVEKFQLCQKICGLYDADQDCFQHRINLCKGACMGLEPASSYNQRAIQAMQSIGLGQSNYLIIDTGREAWERSVILVQNGKYRGFGYIDLDLITGDLDSLKDAVVKYQDTRDSQKIIKTYLESHRVEKLISY